MKLQLFDGGQNSRLAPQLLQANQAVSYFNIDNSTGVLEPVKKAQQTELTKGKYAYYFDKDAVWLDPTVPTDYAVLEDVLYYTNTLGAHKLVDGVEQPLGIAPPTNAPNASTGYGVTPLTGVTVKNVATGGNLPDDAQTYLLVNVDSAGHYSKGLNIRVALSYTANAAVSTYDYDPSFWEAITTVNISDSTTRSITFTTWLGTISNKAKLFRLYDDGFHLVANITTNGQVVTDSVYDISANELLDNKDFGPLDGTYSYVYTFYDNNKGVESAPSGVSTELKVTGGAIQLSNLQVSTNPTVTHKIIYRVGGDITEFTEVVRLPNATTSYLDQIKDTDLAAVLLESDSYDAPPTGLQYITEAYAMLFGAVGTKLYYTPIGVPDAWPGDYYIEIGETITGLGPTANGMLVFTKYKTYIVSGTGPTSLIKSILSADQGCLNHKSIASTQGSLFWISTDGICNSSGNVPSVVSKANLGKISVVPVQAVVYDEVYYCLMNDGKVLAIDYRFSPILKWLQPGVDSLLVANDTLYGSKDGYLWELFSSAEYEEFKYLSPRLAEATVAMLKTYKKVYIYSKGAIKLNIYVDDVLVASGNYTDEDTHVIQIPQDKQRGCFIQFEVTGTGKVYEIWYEAGASKNGQ